MRLAMEFCLLGPLAVRHDGTELAVQRGKQRTILAMLLLNAGRVVSMDQLVQMAWDFAPPRSAQVTVRNYVKRLRTTLGDTDHTLIRTQPPGYLIAIDADQLDVTRFETFLAAARAAARVGSWHPAAEQARAALALWRDEPLLDIESGALTQREVPRLTEMRVQATELRIDADLRRGGHAEVIAELEVLTAAYPLREHPHALLMHALYLDGRQAEALAAYQRARQVFTDQLGTEPGPELQELHRQILNADPVLTATQPWAPTPDGSTRIVPRELPGAVGHFTGRAQELRELTELLNPAGQQAPGTVVISAIGGTAGVGKTALAVHWAHQMADRFPDGQLYVNLRGYDPDQPMSSADALAGFLGALGMAGQDIPADPNERAARYRSLLAGRQILVVADNAGSVAQVRPLLPGTPTCVLLVTSRDSLAGLVARHGARRVDLDLLPSNEAVGLLRELVGVRVDADPGAAGELAELCSRLPLALRVAAERAVAHPGESLAELVTELADQQRRLDLLDASGDQETAVRAVFSWSYERLPQAVARAFRLAGAHPGADLDAYALAALTDGSVEGSRRLLDELARAQLIQSTRAGRYAMYDLLRTYARELSSAHDGAQEPRAALTRLFDHYLRTAADAMDAVLPAERDQRPHVPDATTPTPPVTDDPAAALAWLDVERANLVDMAVYCATRGWPEHTIRLAVILFRHLESGGHHVEASTIHTYAWHAAERTQNLAAQQKTLGYLGAIAVRQGRGADATDHLTRALTLSRLLGDRHGEGRMLAELAILDTQEGRYHQAYRRYQEALVIRQEDGSSIGVARGLACLGFLDTLLGRYPEAEQRLRRSLALSREIGDRYSEAGALNNIGDLHCRMGHHEQADGDFRRALTLARELGDRNGEADVLTDLAELDRRVGRYEDADRHVQEALVLFRGFGDRNGEARALNCQGALALATGRPEHAHTRHFTALSLAGQIHDHYEQARAHDGLARAHDTTGNPELAQHHRQQALRLYTELGTPEAEDVRARLADADGDRLSPATRPTSGNDH